MKTHNVQLSTLNQFKNASESFKRLNPHLLGGLPSAQPQPDGRRIASPADAPQKGGAGGVVISMVGHRRQLLDDDNFVGACKHLRDAIAASLGMDDADPRLRWEYGQFETRGAEGVVVKIQLALGPPLAFAGSPLR
jgi:hypothetical protein